VEDDAVAAGDVDVAHLKKFVRSGGLVLSHGIDGLPDRLNGLRWNGPNAGPSTPCATLRSLRMTDV
jgi:hypothetical protein